ncbi:phage antirepressor [Megamonas funiformis]|uniref:phage antirepressor n=1 Tax=Megamonas funiformis TaxID=437897 RepID=UPI0039F5387E
MDNNLQIFNNAEFGKVRTIVENEEVWFVGKDVAEALGYSNPLKAIRDHVDDDDKGMNKTFTPAGGKQQTIFINESGLYSLVLSSKLPTAKKFKRWVTLEVLPSIRKHGGYLTPAKIEEVLLNPDTIIKLATDLKEERAKRVEVEKQLEINKPKVLFAEAVATAKTSILIGELAKLIKQNGYDIGQKRLFQYLRENGYLIKQKGSAYNSPTQKSMDMGLFEIKERTINHSDHIEIVKTTKVTGKGQIYFINLFSKLERKSA